MDDQGTDAGSGDGSVTGRVTQWLGDQVDALGELRGTAAERALLLSVGFAAVVTGLHIINALFIEGELFNFSEDWNVPTFASTFLFAVAGLGALVTARATPAGAPERRVWLGVGVVMLAFAVEATVDLHTRLEEVGDLQTLVLVMIPIVALALTLVIAGPLVRLPPPLPLLLIGAGALIVLTQAVGALDSTIEIEGYPRDLLILIEEVGELLSPCLALAAAVYARADRIPRSVPRA